MISYVEIIALPPSSRDVYFDGRAKVGPTWDFKNSDMHKWLEENCKDKFDYDWGIELEDDSMIVYVRFAIEDHVKMFKENFETLDLNIERASSGTPIKGQFHELFYDDVDDNHDTYDAEIEAIQWVRENLYDQWRYCYKMNGIMFYFKCEKDATAFKLRFL